eukprot:m.112103 g.112103  ORF g.112103 m.112103 type:complete len:141 (-) comp21404_c0_seq2:68-490(-)
MTVHWAKGMSTSCNAAPLSLPSPIYSHPPQDNGAAVPTGTQTSLPALTSNGMPSTISAPVRIDQKWASFTPTIVVRQRWREMAACVCVWARKGGSSFSGLAQYQQGASAVHLTSADLPPHVDTTPWHLGSSTQPTLTVVF